MRRFLVVICVLLVTGVLFGVWWSGPTVKRDNRPAFRIDPEQPYRIEFGRGSGWHGLSTIKITQDRQAIVHRKRRDHQDGVTNLYWETTTLRLSAEDVAKVLAAIDANHLMELHRSYSDPHIQDGTQWVLWIKQGECEKSVYFNNYFPRSIERFATQLDEILRPRFLGREWNTVPDRESRQHERELWDSIKR